MDPILHGPNGELIRNGQISAPMSAEFRAAADIFIDRLRMAQQIGQSFNGARDFYTVFGYDKTITTRQYRELYQRGGIAGRVVDVYPNATWRGELPFEVIEDEDPENETEFEKQWLALSGRLQVPSKFLRVDKLAGLSTYAVLLIGSSIDGNLETELPRGNNQSQIIYLSPYGGGGATGNSRSVSQIASVDADAMIDTYVQETSDPRFGLPLTYRLKRTDINAPQLQKPVHWSRIIHVAEGLLDDDVNGLPTLERIWNLLLDLEKVTGGGAEAFWLRANQGLHLDVDKDMALADVANTVDSLKEQAEAYKHQLTRWLRTRGVNIDTLGSDVADFMNPADAILTQIAGAKGIPKRILTGSEMGELASTQDRENWRDQIIGRQTGHAGPTIVRQTVDRLIQYGYLPPPAAGPNAYQVKWPHMQVMTEGEKVESAKGLAQVNQVNGETTFTVSEIRDKIGYAALSDEQLAEIEAKKQEEQQAKADAAAQARQQLVDRAKAEGNPFPRAALMKLLGDVAGHEFHGNQYTDSTSEEVDKVVAETPLEHPERPAGGLPTERAIHRAVDEAGRGANITQVSKKPAIVGLHEIKATEVDAMKPRADLVAKYRKGWPVDPPVVNQRGEILDGHHRVASAAAAGRKDIYVIRVKEKREGKRVLEEAKADAEMLAVLEEAVRVGSPEVAQAILRGLNHVDA